MNREELLEKLADLEHEQWMTWAKEILATETISDERRKRWEGLFKSYSGLTKKEKESDRFFAQKVLECITPFICKKCNLYFEPGLEECPVCSTNEDINLSVKKDGGVTDG